MIGTLARSTECQEALPPVTPAAVMRRLAPAILAMAVIRRAAVRVVTLCEVGVQNGLGLSGVALVRRSD